jgi:hypothetical protein
VLSQLAAKKLLDNLLIAADWVLLGNVWKKIQHRYKNPNNGWAFYA